MSENVFADRLHFQFCLNYSVKLRRIVYFRNARNDVEVRNVLSLYCCEGVVYNYTKCGVRRDREGWEHCVSIMLVQPDMYNLINQWDQYLEKFSSAQMWDPLWQRQIFYLFGYTFEINSKDSYSLNFIC